VTNFSIQLCITYVFAIRTNTNELNTMQISHISLFLSSVSLQFLFCFYSRVIDWLSRLLFLAQQYMWMHYSSQLSVRKGKYAHSKWPSHELHHILSHQPICKAKDLKNKEEKMWSIQNHYKKTFRFKVISHILLNSIISYSIAY